MKDSNTASKTLSNDWLTSDALQSILSGKIPNIADIINRSQLLQEEQRLGIARDNQTCIVKEGMLYQTRHIRLKTNTKLSVDIQITNGTIVEGLIKLGGEGRMASLQKLEQTHDLPNVSYLENTNHCRGIILYLLTPMLLPENSAFLPNFRQEEIEHQTQWQGKLNNISLTLVSSIIGKAQREGGWDMAKHEPIPVQDLIPAGSVFYCELKDHSTETIQQAITALHDIQIGKEQHLGRGHIAVGLWHDEATKGANK
jgi:CRISPR-associated protein Cmr3